MWLFSELYYSDYRIMIWQSVKTDSTQRFQSQRFLFLSNLGQVYLSINSLKRRIYAIFLIYVIGKSLF